MNERPGTEQPEVGRAAPKSPDAKLANWHGQGTLRYSARSSLPQPPVHTLRPPGVPRPRRAAIVHSQAPWLRSDSQPTLTARVFPVDRLDFRRETQRRCRTDDDDRQQGVPRLLRRVGKPDGNSMTAQSERTGLIHFQFRHCGGRSRSARVSRHILRSEGGQPSPESRLLKRTSQNRAQRFVCTV